MTRMLMCYDQYGTNNNNNNNNNCCRVRANGKVVLALEGGYNLNSIAHASAQCIQSLLGQPLPPLKLHTKQTHDHFDKKKKKKKETETETMVYAMKVVADLLALHTNKGILRRAHTSTSSTNIL
jgi:hypothetical protein